MPPGKAVVEMVSPPEITSVRVTLALSLGFELSVAVTETGKLPICVGVPVMTPVVAPRINPGGKLEPLQEYGGVPPLAARVALYGVFTTPAGKDVVEIPIPGEMTSVNVAFAVSLVGVELSLTVIVTLAVAILVGVPVMAPVVELMLSPAGSPVALQV